MKQKKTINFRDRKLVFMDFEMTGLDPDIHEVTEVACLVVNPLTNEIEKKYYAKVKPEHIETATKKALKIGGYSPKKWKDGLPAQKVFREINNLSPNAIPAGYCIHKDYSFLYATLKRLHIRDKFDYHLLDVATLAYERLFSKSEPVGITLRDISRCLGVTIPEKHDAMSDIIATYDVYLHLINKKD